MSTSDGWLMSAAARASMKKRPQASAFVRQLGQQALDGRSPADHEVLGLVDDTHAAFAQLAGDAVAAEYLADHIRQDYATRLISRRG